MRLDKELGFLPSQSIELPLPSHAGYETPRPLPTQPPDSGRLSKKGIVEGIRVSPEVGELIKVNNDNSKPGNHTIKNRKPVITFRIRKNGGFGSRILITMSRIQMLRISEGYFFVRSKLILTEKKEYFSKLRGKKGSALKMADPGFLIYAKMADFGLPCLIRKILAKGFH